MISQNYTINTNLAMSTEKITLAKSTSVRNYKKNQIKRKWVIHRKRKQIKYGMYIKMNTLYKSKSI